VTTESIGLDISPQMAAFADAKTRRSRIVVGDILQTPDLGSGFDAITAFRFFLNTEPDMRTRVMHALAARLESSASRLIFNVHMNKHSTYRVRSAYLRLRGQGGLNTLTFGEARRLVEDAGLEVETLLGFGLWPEAVYQHARLGPVVKWLDRRAAGDTPLRWVSHDLLFVCRSRRA
jgi:hypothetical protein